MIIFLIPSRGGYLEKAKRIRAMLGTTAGRKQLAGILKDEGDLELAAKVLEFEAFVFPKNLFNKRKFSRKKL